MLVWRELGVEVLERNTVGGVAWGGEAVMERHSETLLIVAIACGFGIHAGAFVASITLR